MTTGSRKALRASGPVAAICRDRRRAAPREDGAVVVVQGSPEERP